MWYSPGTLHCLYRFRVTVPSKWILYGTKPRQANTHHLEVQFAEKRLKLSQYGSLASPDIELCITVCQFHMLKVQPDAEHARIQGPGPWMANPVLPTSLHVAFATL